jgi:hypothetical protein
MTTTPAQANNGLPLAATPLQRVAAHEGNQVHQGAEEIVAEDPKSRVKEAAGWDQARATMKKNLEDAGYKVKDADASAVRTHHELPGPEEMVLSFDHAGLDILEINRQAAGLSYGELWLRYFELGGMSSRTDVEAIVCGAIVPSDKDYEVIALALNERLAELGRDYPVPYATE